MLFFSFSSPTVKEHKLGGFLASRLRLAILRMHSSGPQQSMQQQSPPQQLSAAAGAHITFFRHGTAHIASGIIWTEVGGNNNVMESFDDEFYQEEVEAAVVAKSLVVAPKSLLRSHPISPFAKYNWCSLKNWRQSGWEDGGRQNWWCAQWSAQVGWGNCGQSGWSSNSSGCCGTRWGHQRNASNRKTT